MAKPSLEKSAYLQTIGNGLHPDIDIFWTGNIHSIKKLFVMFVYKNIRVCSSFTV